MKKFKKFSLFFVGMMLLSLSFIAPNSTEAQSTYSYCYQSNFTCGLRYEKKIGGEVVDSRIELFINMSRTTVFL